MPSERLFTLLLAALTALTSLSIDMNLPAMPALRHEFGASAGAVQLTLSLFLAGFAAGQLCCGPLSDRYGRRPILLGGLVLFTVAGLACLVSQSLTALVVCRALQGAGASVGPILARAMVRDHFEPQAGAGVLSQITQIMVLGPILAPLIGGGLLSAFGWHSIFAVLATAGASLTVLCWRVLPETRIRHEDAGTMMQDMIRGIRGVLSHRASLRHTLTACMVYAGMFAYVSSASFVYTDVFHQSNQHFALYFGITAGGLMAGATANRYLLKRHSTESLLRVGVLLLGGAGTLLAILAALRLGGLFGILVPMSLYFFGVGLLMPNATALAMAPHGRLAGIASSFMGSLQTLSGALAGYWVGVMYNGTSLPLALTTGGLALLACLTFDHGGSRPQAVARGKCPQAAAIPAEL